MTKEEAKKFLSHYICCCQYGNSPFDCDDAKCEFGIAIRTLCDEERPKGEWIEKKVPVGYDYGDTNKRFKEADNDKTN